MIAYRDGQLMIENCSADQLAKHFGTPLYVYSAALLREKCAIYTGLQAPFAVHSHYAVKANSNLSLLGFINRLGMGFDVVSGGELGRCLHVGADPKHIVYSGVGKSESELVQAMHMGIGCINIESEAECRQIVRLAAQRSHPVSLAIRVNPDIAVDTHPYIATSLATSKFGVPIAQVASLARLLAGAVNCRLVGLCCHLGSMIEDYTPVVKACHQLVGLAESLKPDVEIEHISLGGGLAVRYKNEKEPMPQELLDACTPLLRGTGIGVKFEPGRSIVAPSGLTLTRVEYCKETAARNFAVVDAAMNDLPRPSLYDAWHNIISAKECQGKVGSWDVVGPVCESGDFIGKDRELAIQQGDVLAVLTTGGYCASMASNYNSRPRAAEVLVEGSSARLIATRETFAQMVAPEIVAADAQPYNQG